jgi:RNA polymerase-binding transcription factor DksA
MHDLENEEIRRFIESEIQRLARRAAPSPDPSAGETEPFAVNEVRERLEAMRSALERIREGSKGVCVFCGRELPENALTPSGHWHLCATCAPYYAREL